LPEGRDAVGISAGSYHTCAVLDDGSAVCWGLNDVGQLGDGSIDSALSPVYVDIPGGRTASSIDAGDSHSCAVLDNGSAMCWGAGYTGMLGNGLNQDQHYPVYVILSEGDSVSQISAGKEFTCAVMDDDDTKCWGNGGSRLGAGDGVGSQNYPFQTVHSQYTSASVISVSTGDDSACSLMDNGSVMCWGSRSVGQLGDGETSGDVAHPVYVKFIQGSEFVAISTGIYHSCGLLKNDQAMCWGNNGYGKLGTNGYDDSPIPAFVYGEHDWNGGGGEFHHLQSNLFVHEVNDIFAMDVDISTLSVNVEYDFHTTVAWVLSDYIELNVYSYDSQDNSWPVIPGSINHLNE
nr:hypothetical protein [Candidatus Poseidoniaceae archaeon]